MSYLQLRDSSISETEDEKEDAYRSTSQNESRLFSYRNLFGATLISWLATAISLIWIILRRSETVQSHAATPLPFTKVPSRVLTFNPDARFHYTAADTGNAAWSNLMPNDGGIVSIDEPKKYGLTASYTNRNNSRAEVYSMSMYHQLHCLNSIRIRLGTLEGYIDEAEAQVRHGKRSVIANESHVDHCFDYIRQGIMCAGDLSLEHSLVPDEFGFNGWGTAHKCADWETMWHIAMKRRYDTAQP